MITSIEGRIEYKDEDCLTLKVGPISVSLSASKNTLKNVGEIGDFINLYTYLFIKEENMTLYGFINEAELKIFKRLISVSGVGPKLALNILSVFAPSELVSAIVSENIDVLSHAPGVGKKIAGRIILELKSMIEKDGFKDTIFQSMAKDDDVLTALINLGYSPREALNAIAALPSNRQLSLEEKITLALRNLVIR